jgi:hypothetical protein
MRRRVVTGRQTTTGAEGELGEKRWAQSPPRLLLGGFMRIGRLPEGLGGFDSCSVKQTWLGVGIAHTPCCFWRALEYNDSRSRLPLPHATCYMLLHINAHP